MGYLVTVKEEKTGLKLRPVEGQSYPDGTKIDVDKNIQGDVTIRKIVGAGGVLYASDLTDRGKYYQAVDLFVCDGALAKEHSLELAPKEGLEAYERFKKSGVTPSKAAKKRTEVDGKSFLGKLKANEKLQMPLFEETGFYIEEDLWWLLMRNIKRKVNTMVYGHAGTGKTELIMEVAETIGMPITIMDMGAALDPIATLVGVHRLVDGKSVFDYSRFYHAIQKPGIILLDEFSRAPENTTNILLPCLDNRRTLYTDTGSSEIEREVKVHEGCIFIATANVGAEYTGVNLMDKAILSRFFSVEVDYPETAIEEQILINRTRVDSDTASKVVRVCNEIRRECADGVLSKDVSLRESISTCELVFDGYDLESALRFAILPKFEGDFGEGGGERAQILNKILGL